MKSRLELGPNQIKEAIRQYLTGFGWDVDVVEEPRLFQDLRAAEDGGEVETFEVRAQAVVLNAMPAPPASKETN